MANSGTDLHIAGQREVAPLRMALETVVGQNASQIRVVGEENAVHVPDLTLVPVGRLEDVVHRVDGRQFVRVRFDADARVVAQRQNVVDDLQQIRTLLNKINRKGHNGRCLRPLTSKRYCRLGTSMPAMSIRLVNCALW